MNKNTGVVLALGAVVVGFLIWGANSGKDLYFTVSYLDWPLQEVNITNLINLNEGTSEASWREFYSASGYSIVKEYYL